jgi:hypothetical protein
MCVNELAWAKGGLHASHHRSLHCRQLTVNGKSAPTHPSNLHWQGPLAAFFVRTCIGASSLGGSTAPKNGRQHEPCSRSQDRSQGAPLACTLTQMLEELYTVPTLGKGGGEKQWAVHIQVGVHVHTQKLVSELGDHLSRVGLKHDVAHSSRASNAASNTVFIPGASTSSFDARLWSSRVFGSTTLETNHQG